ncbi:hypothetical protein B484DRAFT_457344, partial [Ochromonadaceae sp. CCMP2298]
VLNLTSQWWFQQTGNMGTIPYIPNALLACPHPNVTVAKRCKVFPIEFVMRGYITGTTGTSLWTNYNKGVRDYCGHIFPDGMLKNQKLDSNKLTPTTKSDEHDELVSAQEVVSREFMSQECWDKCATYAHLLFAYGQQTALQHGLILVDTKYEFGLSEAGEVLLIDEVHTPDSSRYWIAETYSAKIADGLEPDNIDKEFLRRWYAAQCDPYADAQLPQAPPALVNELSRRYVMIYETLTGQTLPATTEGGAVEGGDVCASINTALHAYFAK